VGNSMPQRSLFLAGGAFGRVLELVSLAAMGNFSPMGNLHVKYYVAGGKIWNITRNSLMKHLWRKNKDAQPTSIVEVKVA
jgi:hypothetical protein